jgi:hypothetical protein
MKLAYIAVLALALMSVVNAAPDEKPTSPPPGDTIKFVELKHLGSGERLARVINMVQQLSVGQAQIVSDPVLRTVAIKGTAEGVASAEQLLKRFDTPAAETRLRQIQLTMYLVEASDQATPGERLPSELTSAAEQLRTAFGYKGFRLIDTILMQGRENSEFFISGLVPLPDSGSGQKTQYTAQYKNISFGESQKSVHVTGMRFDMRIPIVTTPPGSQNFQYHFTDSGIRTDLTIKDGQKLVIGKLTKDQGERGVFLIVTAKVE